MRKCVQKFSFAVNHDCWNGYQIAQMSNDFNHITNLRRAETTKANTDGEMLHEPELPTGSLPDHRKHMQAQSNSGLYFHTTASLAKWLRRLP